MTSWTSLAEPEIVMTEDRTFVFDARKAGRIDVCTQRTATDWGGSPWMERKVLSDTGRKVAYLATAPGDSSGGFVLRMAPETYMVEGGQATIGTFTHR